MSNKKPLTHFAAFLCFFGIVLSLIFAVDVIILTMEEQEYYHELSIVYTWVNGSDPAYIKQRNQYPPPITGLTSAGANRWRDNNELRFSLRSVFRYAPWVKKIYIVINDDTQPPNWLDVTHPKIEIIYASTILSNSSAAPIFNSNVLELNIHNIPGLTDPFLYMNDDFYLMQPVKPSLFVTKNKHPKFFYTTQRSTPADYIPSKPSQYKLIFKGTNALLNKYFGEHTRRIADHAPYVYSKQAWKEIYHHFGDILDSTLEHRYRQEDDIQSHHLHHYYIQHKTDAIRQHKEYGTPLPDNEIFEPWNNKSSTHSRKNHVGYYRYPLWWSLLNIEFVKGGSDWFFPSLYKVWRPVMMCINDDYDDASNPQAARRTVHDFLLECFPDHSPFEHADVHVVFH